MTCTRVGLTALDLEVKAFQKLHLDFRTVVELHPELKPEDCDFVPKAAVMDSEP